MLLVTQTSYVKYFDKRKGLAVGITASGSGVIVFCLSALLRFLFNNFSFSATMLLYGKPGFTTLFEKFV